MNNCMNETQHEFVKFKHVQELGGLELLNAITTALALCMLCMKLVYAKRA